MSLEKIRKLEGLRQTLQNERSSFIADWKTLSNFISPHRPRFNTSRTNKGGRQNEKILDNTATRARSTLASGMQSGITSPARPWFGLSVADPDLADFGRVKDILHLVNQRMLGALLNTNFYNISPITYGDVGTYATAAMFVEKDEKNVIHCFDMPIGSYSLGKDRKGHINVCTRELQMTVRQIVADFGAKPDGTIDWTNISAHVKNQWDTAQYEDWIDIIHVIEPNQEFDANAVESKFKKYSSIYYELHPGGDNDSLRINKEGKFLRESGFDRFPVLAPRWHVNSEDVYGTDCPGINSLGDIKQLQKGESKSLQGIEKSINPPVTAPTSLRKHKATTLPGGITYVDSQSANDAFRAVYKVDFNVERMEAKQAQVRQRIEKAWYNDLFLMLTNTDRRQITATEVAERKEEKLLALGPTLQQLDQDMLRPLVDIVFDNMMEMGKLPPPEQWPEELQDQELKVEFRSIMHEAQKLVGVNTLERFGNFVAGISQFKPEALDKINQDKYVDVVADALSVPPGIVREQAEVIEIRRERAQVQQEQEKAELAKTESEAVRNLSQSQINDNNALGAIAGQSAIPV